MLKAMEKTRHIWLGAMAFGWLTAAQPSLAGDQARQHFALEPQPLGEALRAISRQSGREIMFPSAAVQGRRTPALKGDYTPDEAVRSLLSTTGLVADYRPDVILIRGRGHPSTAVASAADDGEEIVVTGSRIRGAPAASPLTVVSQTEMLRAGQSNLGDVIRTIPQNFAGGQNPGIGQDVPVGSGENIGGGSSINLRGLGQDATLTLLNGHRLAYGGYRQSVDVSSIPLDAVDRIEIVGDGASALYGSDAVAGVANIILKPDYDGLSAGVRFGGATEGGASQQQYHVVGGLRSSTGGFLLAGEIGRDGAIQARQRAYSVITNPGLSLYPALRRKNLLFSGHQTLTPTLDLSVDATFDHRSDFRTYSITGVVGTPFFHITSRGTSYAVTPTLTWRPSDRWTLSLNGVYGVDRVHYGADMIAAAGTSPFLRACYCNKAGSVEASATGTLFALPGGDAKIAFGGGFRTNRFRAFRTVGGAQNIAATQDAYYGFGELSLPLVSPQLGLAWAHRLVLSAALRYESYKHVDHLATPKLGLVYAPTQDFDVKGSWGKSFKAPTLFQRFNTPALSYSTAASRGAVGLPSTATVLFLLNGNPDLKAERATTWSATFAAHPHGIPGLKLELSYFNIHYKDRISAPIAIVNQSLSNPAYADLVTLNPTPAQIADALAGRTVFLGVAGAVNPANVVAVIDNRNRNLARQNISGVDLAASYAFVIGAYGQLNLDGDVSYLRSRQQVNPLAPFTSLAGNYFNPPHWRGRGGVGWDYGDLSATLYGNYIGGIVDSRTRPFVDLGSMTTFDATLRYHIASGPGLLRNIDLTASVENMFDVHPPRARSSFVFEPPYDSTNYSPIGRFISVGITKTW